MSDPALHEVSPAPAPPDAVTTWVPRHATDLVRTLRRGQLGAWDPTQRRTHDGAVWRTIRTPSGPASARFTQSGAELRCEAWGAGAEHVVARAPWLAGGDDDPTGFVAAHPLLELAHRRHAGLRIAGSGDMLHGLVGAILEQRVEYVAAMRSWSQLVGRLGEPAPGPVPTGMRIFPAGAAWHTIGEGDWRAVGVDLRRAAAIRWVAARERSLQRLVDDASPLDAVDRALRALPGIGVWTSAEVRQRVLGDPDAVSVGDVHLPRDVGMTLVGRAFDDAELLAYLEPWRGHRYRVTRLVYAAGAASGPRRAPRRTPGPRPERRV
ncbi:MULTISPECIES: DNA-3-methyladenine glycosylase family protein [unclassified Agrococcus]|uniref:DNA-3-methyladenine glycosylase family protein n=1 Tax=unclassified Agrococcus TaxID=2615065 RepID=UPI003612EF6F